jgi:hypothetical protein
MSPRRYGGGVGIMGELFGRGLNDEGNEDGTGEGHRPRFDLDLDGGKVRLPGARPADPPEPDRPR